MGEGRIVGIGVNGEQVGALRTCEPVREVFTHSRWTRPPPHTPQCPCLAPLRASWAPEAAAWSFDSRRLLFVKTRVSGRVLAPSADGALGRASCRCPQVCVTVPKDPATPVHVAIPARPPSPVLSLPLWSLTPASTSASRCLRASGLSSALAAFGNSSFSSSNPSTISWPSGRSSFYLLKHSSWQSSLCPSFLGSPTPPSWLSGRGLGELWLCPLSWATQATLQAVLLGPAAHPHQGARPQPFLMRPRLSVCPLLFS